MSFFFTNDKRNKKGALSKDKTVPNPEKAGRQQEKGEVWADVNEPIKFVNEAAKVECPFCTSPIANVKVTSNTVSLQDKPYMTIGDKDGKTNFLFEGNCKAVRGSSKPPCKTVINLGEWKNFSESMIDDYNALLQKSTIPCTVSGKDIRIVDSGQRAIFPEAGFLKPKVLE